MSASQEIRQRIQARVDRGQFLPNLLRIIREGSGDVHQDFVDKLSNVASGLRDILDQADLIRRIDYIPSTF